MTATMLAGLIRTITGARPLWLGCEPSLNPRVYFANHASNLDGPTIWASLPSVVRKQTRPVAARDYWTAGPLRRYLAERVFNTVLIERKRPTRNDNPIDDMLNAIGETGSLILFPEGGRSTGPDPLPFKSGLYHLAKRRPDLELIPVLLDNMNRILPKGELLPVPLICSVTFGAAMRLECEERRDQFLERARQAVLSLRQQEHQ